MALESIALIVGSISVMPFWTLMILLPRWTLTERICRQPWIVVPPIVLYILMLIIALFNGQIRTMAAVNLLDPASISAMLGLPVIAVGAWLHMLALDLWTGRWVYLDSRDKRLNVGGVSLVLVLVLGFAPLGLAIYLLWQFVRQRNQSPQ
jgi:hypothetical protein